MELQHSAPETIAEIYRALLDIPVYLGQPIEDTDETIAPTIDIEALDRTDDLYRKAA